MQPIHSNPGQEQGRKPGNSRAPASVYVQVLVDGGRMDPSYRVAGEENTSVTFCRRHQEMSATFRGISQDCINYEGQVFLNEDCLLDEEINLIKDTTTANSFNFVRKDLPQGTYLIEVQTMISSDSKTSNGSANARGAIGNHSRSQVCRGRHGYRCSSHLGLGMGPGPDCPITQY